LTARSNSICGRRHRGMPAPTDQHLCIGRDPVCSGEGHDERPSYLVGEALPDERLHVVEEALAQIVFHGLCARVGQHQLTVLRGAVGRGSTVGMALMAA